MNASIDEIYRQRQRRFQGSDVYSLFSLGNLFMVQQRERAVLALLRQTGFYPLTHRRVLEVGCGGGGVLREFLSYGVHPANLHGMELLEWRLAEAKKLSPNLPLVCADGQHLPYRDRSFDLVVQYTVFTSILEDRVKRDFASEMLRVLKPGGLILWYDFWLNPANRQVRGIRPAEVRRLFPGCSFTFRRITLAPPIARRLAPHSWLLCHVLESLRLFNSHYLVAIRPLT